MSKTWVNEEFSNASKKPQMSTDQYLQARAKTLAREIELFKEIAQNTGTKATDFIVKLDTIGPFPRYTGNVQIHRNQVRKTDGYKLIHDICKAADINVEILYEEEFLNGGHQPPTCTPNITIFLDEKYSAKDLTPETVPDPVPGEGTGNKFSYFRTSPRRRYPAQSI